MTWQRVFSTGFEEQSLGELYNNFRSGVMQIVQDIVYTGESSLELIENNNAPTISNFGEWDYLRAGFYFHVSTPFVSDPLITGVLTTKSSFPDNPRIVLLQDESTDEFYILEEAVEVARFSPFIVPGFDIGQWVHIGVVAHTGVSGYFSVYLNGFLLYKYNTSYLEGITQFRMPGNSGFGTLSPTYRADDCYVDVSNDTEVDSPPPSPRFYPLWPNANGTENEWEILGGDNRAAGMSLRPKLKNDVPILRATTEGQTELYRTNSVSGFDDHNVEAVIVKARGMYGDAREPKDITLVIKDDDDNELESADKDLELGYTTVQHRFATRPDGSDWDFSMAGIEIGIRS